MTEPVTLVAGPTASGKSALALRLARETGAEIINADALQIYADLRILTARPSPEDEATAPHHLYGVADAAEAWSVGRWLRAVAGILEDVRTRGRPVILVGGTGLYFTSLTRGLAEIPETSPALRAEVLDIYRAEGEAAFRARLAAVDAEAAARIAPHDRQRLTRALEVHLATGRPMSAWRIPAPPLLPEGSYRAVIVEPPRAALFARADARLADMFEHGAIEETARLVGRGLPPALPIMKALGVSRIAALLRGEIGRAEALDLARRDTRRYAKRQLTWFRNQMAHWPRIASAAEDAPA